MSLKYCAADFAIKTVTERGEFTGYASTYDVVDSVGDVVKRGAFAETIKNRPTVPLLWQHSIAEPIGVGRLQDSTDGLIVHGQLAIDSVTKAREAHALLRLGALNGLSIGYNALDYDFGLYNGHHVRFLKQIDVMECSVVTFPANAAATVTVVKTADEALTYEEQFALLLADMRVTSLALRLRSLLRS